MSKVLVYWTKVKWVISRCLALIILVVSIKPLSKCLTEPRVV